MTQSPAGGAAEVKTADEACQEAIGPFVRFSLTLLAKAPFVHCVRLVTEYQDYEKPYYYHCAHGVQFEGPHQDEDLDVVPETRRVERAAKRLFWLLPFKRHDGAGQEAATLTVSRDEVEFFVENADAEDVEGPLGSVRGVTWPVGPDGVLGAPVKHLLVNWGIAQSAHERAAEHAEAGTPSRLLFWFTDAERAWLTAEGLAPVRAKPLEGGYWRVELNPSCTLLGTTPMARPGNHS